MRMAFGIFTLARAAYFVAKFDRLARYEYTHSVLICLWHDGHFLADQGDDVHGVDLGVVVGDLGDVGVVEP